MAKCYERIADLKAISKEEWLELRKSGIGGSDAGAVVGLNPYSSAYSVYHEKMGLVEPFEGNDKTRLGQDLEEYIAKRFEEKTGKRVRRLNAMLRSKEYPYMIADIDREVVGEDAGVECKSTTNFDGYKFDEGEYPAYWACQCYHYMAVKGAKRWYLVVLDLSSGKVHVITIERNEAEIAALIVLEKRFWTEHIESKTPPLPNGSEQCDEIIKEKYPLADDNAPAVDLMGYGKEMGRLEIIKGEIKILEREKDAIEQTLKEALGVASAGEYEQYKVSYKNTVSTRLDTKRLKEELPQVYEQYASDSTSRRFLFTVKK